MNKRNHHWQTITNRILSTKGKLPYVAPYLKVIEVEESRLICTSVEPGQGGSVEKDFDNKGDVEGGEWGVEDED